MRSMRRLRRMALTVAGSAVAAFFVAPYVVMLLDALKPAAELRASPPRFLPTAWQPQNFVEVVRDPAFRSALRVSLTVALASTLLAVAAAVPAAYHTARRRFRGRSAFLFLVLVTFRPPAGSSLSRVLRARLVKPRRRAIGPTPPSTGLRRVDLRGVLCVDSREIERLPRSRLRRSAPSGVVLPSPVRIVTAARLLIAAWNEYTWRSPS